MKASARGAVPWLQSRIRSFVFAFTGLVHLLREPNARIHAFASVLVLGLSVWLGLSAQGWALIVLAITAVWVAEALNTALESLADALTREQHPLVGAAKDVAAAGVLIAAFGATLVGACVLGPPLLRLLVR